MCCWSRSLIRVRAAWYFCGFTIPPGGRKGTVGDTHQMNFWNLTSRTTYLTPSSRLLTIPCSISKEKASSCLRSEEHTSELQSHLNLVCRLLLEKKKKII